MTQRDLIRATVGEIASSGQRGADELQSQLLDRASDIIVAFLNKNSVEPEDVPGLIASVHASLSRLFGPVSQAGSAGGVAKPVPNVQKTVTPDYIICLEDGKRLQTLKRYIGRRYGLSPDQYRQKWNLPDNYPMVAPNYAKRRSQIAKKMGLGRKPAKKRRKSR